MAQLILVIFHIRKAHTYCMNMTSSHIQINKLSSFATVLPSYTPLCYLKRYSKETSNESLIIKKAFTPTNNIFFFLNNNVFVKLYLQSPLNEFFRALVILQKLVVEKKLNSPIRTYLVTEAEP